MIQFITFNFNWDVYHGLNMIQTDVIFLTYLNTYVSFTENFKHLNQALNIKEEVIYRMASRK